MDLSENWRWMRSSHWILWSWGKLIWMTFLIAWRRWRSQCHQIAWLHSKLGTINLERAQDNFTILNLNCHIIYIQINIFVFMTKEWKVLTLAFCCELRLYINKVTLDSEQNLNSTSQSLSQPEYKLKLCLSRVHTEKT